MPNQMEETHRDDDTGALHFLPRVALSVDFAELMGCVASIVIGKAMRMEERTVSAALNTNYAELGAFGKYRGRLQECDAPPPILPGSRSSAR